MRRRRRAAAPRRTVFTVLGDPGTLASAHGHPRRRGRHRRARGGTARVERSRLAGVGALRAAADASLRSPAAPAAARPVRVARTVTREGPALNPDDLTYTAEHEWLRPQGDVVRSASRPTRRRRSATSSSSRSPLWAPRRGRPGAGRGGVDQERVRRLRAGRRHGRARSTTRSTPTRSWSTATRTARAGWSSSPSRTAPAADRRRAARRGGVRRAPAVTPAAPDPRPEVEGLRASGRRLTLGDRAHYGSCATRSRWHAQRPSSSAADSPRAAATTRRAAHVFCTQCGQQNPDGSRFCARCGAALPAPCQRPGPSPIDTTSTISLAGPRGRARDRRRARPDARPGPGRAAAGRHRPCWWSSAGRTPAAGSCSTPDVTTAGRHPESDIFLDDVTVSRRHAEFVREGAGFVVRDVGSLNGTYLDRAAHRAGRAGRRRRGADRQVPAGLPRRAAAAGTTA